MPILCHECMQLLLVFFNIVAIYFIVLLTHEMCAVFLNLNYTLTIIYTEFLPLSHKYTYDNMN